MDKSMQNFYEIVKRNLDRQEMVKKAVRGMESMAGGATSGSRAKISPEFLQMVKTGRIPTGPLTELKRAVGPAGKPVSSYTVSSTGRTTTQGNLTPRQRAEMLATAGKRVAKRAFPVAAGIAAGAGAIAGTKMGKRMGVQTRQAMDQLRSKVISRLLGLAQ